jgi:hypothetical protein
MKNNNSKTLWVFGDSFTNHSYDDCPNELRNVIRQWPNIVSDYYKLNLENFGQDGYSNQQIIHSVLKTIYQVKEGDSVIIGFTDPLRIITIKNNKIKTFTNSFYFQSKKEIDKYPFHYVKHILIPNEKTIHDFYIEQLNGLKKLILSMGCSVYTFDHFIWRSFESVTKYTNGKIVNQHWSKKGHEDMAKLIIDNLHKEKKIL